MSTMLHHLSGLVELVCVYVTKRKLWVLQVMGKVLVVIIFTFHSILYAYFLKLLAMNGINPSTLKG